MADEREIIRNEVQGIEKFGNDCFSHNIFPPGFHRCKYDLRNIAICDADGFLDFDNGCVLVYRCV